MWPHTTLFVKATSLHSWFIWSLFSTYKPFLFLLVRRDIFLIPRCSGYLFFNRDGKFYIYLCYISSCEIWCILHFSILLNFVWAAEQIKPPSMSSPKSLSLPFRIWQQILSLFPLSDHVAGIYQGTSCCCCYVLTFLVLCYFLCSSCL